MQSSDSEQSDGDSNEGQHRLKEKKDKGAAEEDEENMKLSVNYKEFNKIVLQRKDILKWHDMPCFREHSTHMFVKVVIGSGTYAVARLMSINTRSDTFKIDNKSCNIWVELSYSGKIRSFKLQMISDRAVDDDEFNTFKKDFCFC